MASRIFIKASSNLRQIFKHQSNNAICANRNKIKEALNVLFFFLQFHEKYSPLLFSVIETRKSVARRTSPSYR